MRYFNRDLSCRLVSIEKIHIHTANLLYNSRSARHISLA